MRYLAFLERGAMASIVWLAGSFACGCNGSTNANSSASPAGVACETDGGCPNGTLCSPSLGCVQCVVTTDCPTATPVCGPSGQCLQCESSSDCSGTTPACYPATHTCRAACAPDGGGGVACAGGLMCDTATGACVGCVTSNDCPTTRRVCDPFSQTCVECEMDSDCSGATPRCRNEVCVACATNADCSGATPVCGNAGTCRAGCVDDTQCTTAAAPVCDTTTNACVGCLSDGDCAGRTGGADGGVATPYCATNAVQGGANRCVACRAAMADAGVQGCPAGRACVLGACL